MSDYKIETHVSCDYDFAKRIPSSPMTVEIAITDEERGEKRHFKEAVEPGSKPDGAWGLFVGQIADPACDLPSVMGEEWFDQSKWLRSRGTQWSQQSPLDVPWCDKPATVCCRTYQTGQDDGTLFMTARGKLVLDDDLSAALSEIEPCEWFLPDYKPEDWIAHEGRFSDPYSFKESERDWTRKKILRGLEVATAELAHYRKMAEVYEAKTGIPIQSNLLAD